MPESNVSRIIARQAESSQNRPYSLHCSLGEITLNTPSTPVVISLTSFTPLSKVQKQIRLSGPVLLYVFVAHRGLDPDDDGNNEHS